MIKVRDMTLEEMQALVRRIGFGHLGCARDGRPYVVPMNYAYDSPDLYFFTTEGTKTEFMDANPEVCLQVEEITDASRWQSVMLTGRAERLGQPADTERAMQILTARNPTLAPAISDTRIDAWGRANNIRIYRLRPSIIDGRAAEPGAPECT
jgi:uncharacterized protein